MKEYLGKAKFQIENDVTQKLAGVDVKKEVEDLAKITAVKMALRNFIKEEIIEKKQNDSYQSENVDLSKDAVFFEPYLGIYIKSKSASVKGVKNLATIVFDDFSFIKDFFGIEIEYELIHEDEESFYSATVKKMKDQNFVLSEK